MIVLLCALACAAGFTSYLAQQRGFSSRRSGLTPAFTLVDTHGRATTASTFAGRWALVFFGYTHCPDFCPTALYTIGTSLKELGPLADAVTPIFITVDPERDTETLLRDYLDNFDARIVGLSGSDAQVRSAARSFNVYYARRQSGDDYSIDHTAAMFVLDPKGRLVLVLPYDTDASALTGRLRSLLAANG